MTDAINSHSRRMYNAQKNTRADLANPLDDPRVVALVEALRLSKDAFNSIGQSNGATRKAEGAIDAALAAIEGGGECNTSY